MDTSNNTTPAEKARILTLPAQPQAVGEARHRVHSLLRYWASPVDWDTAVLLLSEVVTNAIVHGTNPDPAASDEIRVIVRQGPGGVRIEVHDHGDGEPAPAHTGQDWAAESGRGLDLVELLADEWGTKHEGQGKSVYFMLAAASKPACRDNAMHTTNPHATSAASDDGPRPLPPPVGAPAFRSRKATAAETSLARPLVGAR